MYEQELGLFGSRPLEVAPLLLVVDRCDDPVTLFIEPVDLLGSFRLIDWALLDY